MRRTALFAFALLALTATAAIADPVEDFYKGKQLRFVIRAAPGGNYDLYMRLLARHITRYMPGHPEALPGEHARGRGPHRAQLHAQRRAA